MVGDFTCTLSFESHEKKCERFSRDFSLSKILPEVTPKMTRVEKAYTSIWHDFIRKYFLPNAHSRNNEKDV